MDKMYEDGGLATDGMSVDPVSGNEVPLGSNAEDVRDDLDAKLSPGEYVVPADVVKYFGVAHFEKLRDRAKSGMEDMAEDGRIGGESVDIKDDYTLSGDMETIDGYATGGLVDGTDIDGIIGRVKAAAEADPSIVNMLKSKGIFIQAPQVGSAEAPSATPANVATQDNIPGFAEGGFADGAPGRSSFNPADYQMGFSIAPPKGSENAQDTAPVCPEGYAWDPETKVCMPKSVKAPAATSTQSTTSSRNRDGGSSTSNRAPAGDSNAWMSKYNYDDPDELFKQSMEAVATSATEAKESKGLMGRMGDSFLSGNGLLGGVLGGGGGLAGGLLTGALGKFMSATNSAQVSANVMALEAMGKPELAAQLKAQVGLYDSEAGLPKVLGGMYDGDKLFESLETTRGSFSPVQEGMTATTTPGLGTPTKSSRPSDGSAGRNVTKTVDRVMKSKSGPKDKDRNGGVDYNTATSKDGKTIVSRATGSTAPTSSSRPPTRGVTTTRANTPPPSVPQKKKESYSTKMKRGGGFNKGGLMKKPTK